MYDIKAGYRHRVDNPFFDDTGNEDDWQREVYEMAAAEAAALDAELVYDVGCGSAYKLMEHFADIETVGFDLEPTIETAKRRYPDRQWRVSDLDDTIAEPADIVVCSDVVEHIPDPDDLMGFLARLNCTRLFLSTPERKLIYGFDHAGPPSHQPHCREWTFDEFGAYVRRWFDVEQHLVTNEEQATQLTVCVPKSNGAGNTS